MWRLILFALLLGLFGWILDLPHNLRHLYWTLRGKVRELPEDVLRSLPAIRDEWIDTVMSTEPANREKAEKGIDMIYEAVGLKPPQIKIWCQSPLEGYVVAKTLNASKNIGDIIDGLPIIKALENAEYRVSVNVEHIIYDTVWNTVASHCETTSQLIENWVCGMDPADALKALPNDIKDRFGSSMEEDNSSSDEGFFFDFGPENCANLACYNVYSYIIDETPVLSGTALVAKNSGWWWQFEHAVVLTERPSKMLLNEANLLHCEDGPAVEFRDGSSVYFWHGYVLPKTHNWIIADKEKLSPEIIDNESNIELRRIMLEIYGFDRYLAQRPYTVVDEDLNLGQPRRLLQIEFEDESVRILDVRNGSLEADGSRRRFFLGAMAGADTVHGAVAMSYGIAPVYYREGVRT